MSLAAHRAYPVPVPVMALGPPADSRPNANANPNSSPPTPNPKAAAAAAAAIRASPASAYHDVMAELHALLISLDTETRTEMARKRAEVCQIREGLVRLREELDVGV
ncbi:hypothetical protein IAU60_003651 [Kwoniella sp. DSM 27419]